MSKFNKFSSASPSHNDLAILNFNGPELVSQLAWMKERGLSKQIGNIQKKEYSDYGSFNAMKDNEEECDINCNLLLPIIKCYPYILFQRKIQFHWNDKEKVINFLKKFLVFHLKLMDMVSLNTWASQDGSSGKKFWEQISNHFSVKYHALLESIAQELVNNSVNYTAQVKYPYACMKMNFTFIIQCFISCTRPPLCPANCAYSQRHTTT